MNSLAYSVVGSSCVGLYALAFGGKARSVCECHFSGDGDSQALKILQGQLDRCGPESLGARACPDCPPCQGTAIGATVIAVFLAVAFAFALGVLSGCFLARRYSAPLQAPVASEVPAADPLFELLDAPAHGAAAPPRWVPRGNPHGRRL